MDTAHRPVRLLRVPALLDARFLAEGPPRAAGIPADVLAARVGPPRLPEALLRDELLAILPEHDRRLGADHPDRRHGRRHRRLQLDPLRVPRPNPGGSTHTARLHVPAHHHAGPALP